MMQEPRIRLRWLVVIAAAVLALGGVAISPALGGPGFLTMQKAKKVFFTKKKTNGLFLRKSDAFTQGQADAAFLTPAEGDSRYLTPAEGDSRYLPRTGTTKLQVTPAEWVNTTGGGTANPATTFVILEGPGGASTSSFAAATTVPSTVQGTGVSVVSFELCYDATDPGVVALTDVNLTRVSGATPAQPLGTVDHPVNDPTDRHDATCRTYSPASPVPVGANDFVDVAAAVQYSGPGAVVITRLTINLTT